MRRRTAAALACALLLASTAASRAEEPTGKSSDTSAGDIRAGKSSETPSGKPPDLVPVDSPIAGFMRNSSGWSVTMSFADPVTAIAWRNGDVGDYRETGFLDTLDPRTRKRMANPTFELDKDQPETTLYVRAIDLNDNPQGPFPVHFDPAAELARGDRRLLEMTASSWVSFRQFNGLLLYYSQLMSYRCGIREVHIGIDKATPDDTIELPPCDPLHYAEIPADAKPYLKLPPKTQSATVQLVYRDGSVSEAKTFKNDDR
jgi:hypothetical protein